MVTEKASLAITVQNVLGNFVGEMSIYAMCLIFMMIGLVLTNCITNIVAMQLTIPIIATFMLAKGMNPSLVIAITGIMLNHGLVMPSGSPIGSFIHGNSEWMTSKQCYLYATISSICLAISVALIGLPLSLMLT